MNTFKSFLEQKMISEDLGGIGTPATLPPAGAPPAPAAGAPPGAPPMGGMDPMGGMGGMGMGAPPMGGMGAPPMGAPAGGTAAPNKLKAYNVWDVLEKVLGNEADVPQQ